NLLTRMASFGSWADSVSPLALRPPVTRGLPLSRDGNVSDRTLYVHEACAAGQRAAARAFADLDRPNAAWVFSDHCVQRNDRCLPRDGCLAPAGDERRREQVGLLCRRG